MTVLRVFVSYRRSDSSSATHAIQRELTRRRVGVWRRPFLDVDSTPPGVDFRKHIADVLTECAVVVIVIGRNWLAAEDESGERRLDDPSDYHRIEIETALTGDATVMPVLVEGATMPHPAELPATVRDLAYLNAWRVDERRFVKDLKEFSKHVKDARWERQMTHAKEELPQWLWNMSESSMLNGSYRRYRRWRIRRRRE